MKEEHWLVASHIHPNVGVGSGTEPETQAYAMTGSWTGGPLQDDSQQTEPHHSGLNSFLKL